VVLSGLLAQAHKFLLPKSSYDRKLKAIWEDFIDFCNAHELVALPASRDSVLAYLVWSDIRGRTVKPTLVLTAISNQHSGQNLSDPTKSYEFQTVGLESLVVAITNGSYKHNCCYKNGNWVNINEENQITEQTYEWHYDEDELT
ncbi:23784_t:CDS:2, partial [Gigaspora rosea]